jgi:hypothetical protein
LYVIFISPMCATCPPILPSLNQRDVRRVFQWCYHSPTRDVHVLFLSRFPFKWRPMTVKTWPSQHALSCCE